MEKKRGGWSIDPTLGGPAVNVPQTAIQLAGPHAPTRKETSGKKGEPFGKGRNDGDLVEGENKHETQAYSRKGQKQRGKRESPASRVISSQTQKTPPVGQRLKKPRRLFGTREALPVGRGKNGKRGHAEHKKKDCSHPGTGHYHGGPKKKNIGGKHGKPGPGKKEVVRKQKEVQRRGASNERGPGGVPNQGVLEWALERIEKRTQGKKGGGALGKNTSGGGGCYKKTPRQGGVGGGAPREDIFWS